MDQIEKLAAQLSLAQKERKDWEKEEKKLKDQLSRLLDEDAPEEKDFLLLPRSLATNVQDIEDYFHCRFGEMYQITSIEEDLIENHWTVVYRKRPQYVGVKKQAGQYEIARSSYSVGDDIDLDVLKEALNDDVLFATLVDFEHKRVPNPEGIQMWIERDPTAFAILNLAAKAGSPRTRIDVKKVKDEDRISGMSEDGED